MLRDPDPRPDLRQLLRVSAAEGSPAAAAALGAAAGALSAGGISGGAPVSWKAAGSLGGILGPLRATVAGAGVDPLRGSWVVNLVDLRALRASLQKRTLRAVLPEDLLTVLLCIS